MDFDWQAEESEIKKRVTDIFKAPAQLEMEALEDADLTGIKQITNQYMERLAETGYLGLGLGPGGLPGLMGLILAQEALAGASGSLFLAVEATARLFGGLLAGWGGPKLEKEILEPLKSGSVIAGVAMAEPGGTEPFEGWRTTAVKNDKGYSVTGQKSFVTNGPIADWLAVSGAVEGKPAFFLIEPGQEGVVLGPRLNTLGYNGLAASTLALTDVLVPDHLVIGPFDDRAPLDFLSLMQDLILSVASLGVIVRTMNASNLHARSHHRGAKPVFSHQEVRFKLADMFTLYQTAQLLAYRAGWFWSINDREAEALIGCAKVFCAEAAENVAGKAMQVMAGEGYVLGNPVERGFREAKYAPVAGTTSELSRMKIAEDVLKRHPV